MITQETAGKIWAAWREIETAKKLLVDLAEREHDAHDKHARRLPDAFGRQRVLQLGVPSGENAHRLLDVPPELGEAVIKAYILDRQGLLHGLNELARAELDGAAEPQGSTP